MDFVAIQAVIRDRHTDLHTPSLSGRAHTCRQKNQGKGMWGALLPVEYQLPVRGKLVECGFSVAGRRFSFYCCCVFFSLFPARVSGAWIAKLAGSVKLPYSMVQRDMTIQSGKVYFSVLSCAVMSLKNNNSDITCKVYLKPSTGEAWAFACISKYHMYWHCRLRNWCCCLDESGCSAFTSAEIYSQTFISLDT